MPHQLMAVCLTLALTTVLPTPARAAPPAGCQHPPAPVAHRGGTEQHTENTLGAFRSAAQNGVGELELDVRFDAAGTPVVLHDPTVDRVSPATGAIVDLDATTTRIPTDDGQYIPTLRETLALAATFPAHVLVELKTTPTPAQWTVVDDQITGTIGRPGVTVMSFDPAVVMQARQRIPDTTTALIQEAGYLTPAQIRQYGDSYVKVSSAYSPGRAEQWHAGGVRLYAWTVDTSAGWQALLGLPIDGMITNKPLAYQQWLRHTCPE